MKLPRAWFLPPEHDVLAMLCAEADTSCAAVELLVQWVHGLITAVEAAGRIRSLVGEVERQRRELHVAVRERFSTPLQGEDILELAQRLAELVEDVHRLVQEAELTAVTPDPNITEIVEGIADANRMCRHAVARLPHADAGDVADEAARLLEPAEHAYRGAITELNDEVDLRTEIRRRELYRRAEHATTAVARVLHRIWYGVSKTE
ncbi:hypothetical protein OOZ19_04050 [Saccharopolyspora sp. NFXS83]|uniref:DUF47 domain-containing protein n=1 Tax=Saccharopolyspora sp. NFXS83 TaxID=2993560 RepID=UPI00224AE884|nr:hypothetical protein [Saccharopolyspora sp. NFXS83]MCX2729401.1 hypothetical protein [Saccharopolyspora sp. NFXS83]